VDGGGRLHVDYYDFPNGDLKYATCAGSCELATNWQTVVVDAAGDVGEYISLAVDPGGAVHVAYSDNTDGDLEYATCATGCDVVDNWHTATVDAAGSVGWFTSLALGPGGQLHVSYYDLTNEDLKYATCAAGCTDGANWHAATVDAPENAGGFTSLALDAAGRVHVSYYDLTNTDLKDATCAASCDLGTNWQPVTVDPGGSVGVNTSLAVDAFGRLHVSYYLVSNADLKYATCVASCALAGNWQLSTVDFAGNVGDYTSLAVDAAGRLHVSYFDSGNGDLKYIE
jgi:threonine dehydrogenase-like Zn-dependent dehydrogenase